LLTVLQEGTIVSPEQRIRQKEDDLRQMRMYEAAFVIDEDGSVLIDKTSGIAYEIEFTEEEIASIRAASNPVMTHNHPRGWDVGPEDARRAGSSFSPNDIELACKAGLAEIRAVSPRYRFTMKPAGKRFQPSDWQAIDLVFSVEQEAVKAEKGTAVMQGLLRRDEYIADVLHETWKRVASLLGLEYLRIEE
jgi:hypothetical protein